MGNLFKKFILLMAYMYVKGSAGIVKLENINEKK